MNAKIIKIIGAGNLAVERIVIKVSADDEIGEYVLLKSAVINENITTAINKVFWFPDRAVSKGDFVVLYSKFGVPSEKVGKDGKYHFFYWGNESPLWQEENTAGVLMHINDWDFFTSKR